MKQNSKAYKPLLWPTLITMPALIILMCLGTWQMQRLAYKTELLRQIDTRINLQAKPLPGHAQWQHMKKDIWNFTPVTLKGVFDHENEFHVFTHISDDKGRFQKAGYFIVTPVKLSASERYIFVSRGFIPENLKDAAKRPEGQLKGDISIQGVLRFPERANIFTPEPDIKKNIWFVRDTIKMQAQFSGRQFAPFFVVLKSSDPQPDLPAARSVRPVIKNNHLSYALTWYGMAICLLTIYILYCLRYMKRT